MKCNIKPKGYNVFQARLYNITDDIYSKVTFINKEEAIKHILDSFTQDAYGQLFARGVIRTIDPCLSQWIVPWSVDNNKALLFIEDEYIIDSWKITFYDMGDDIILLQEVDNNPTEEKLRKQMVYLNAFYVVVSCKEIGCSERFVIARTYRNNKFSINILNFDPKATKLKPDETLEDRYKHLIDQDAKETERINSNRRTCINEATD
ncbi:MAG: hypothetical protein BGN88_09415 [Clostridiales bacterium 43-6]|nr:MAG: hypothetical protein BGN88_09415 [Clostridiales bacterium 43-6]